MSRRRKKPRKEWPTVCVKIPHDKLQETMEDMPTHKYSAFARVCRHLKDRKTKKIISLGVGDPCSSLSARTQLSFVLKVCKECGIEENIYSDPVLCPECSRFLSNMGFIIDPDKAGKYEFSSDTLFFMPHCPRFLFHNLLVSNWSLDQIRKLFILGNSFAGYSKSYRMFIHTVRTATEDVFDTGIIADESLDFDGSTLFNELSLMSFQGPDEKAGDLFDTPREFLDAKSLG